MNGLTFAELFLKYKVVFTPVCPPLQDASAAEPPRHSAAEEINYNVAGDCWSARGELRLRSMEECRLLSRWR